VNASVSNLPKLQDQEIDTLQNDFSSNSLLMLEESRSLDSLPSPQSSQANRWSTLNVFTSTFFTIFLAELGDKTQIATLLMSAESHSPWLVFAGAASALVATSLIGVCLGQWLSTRLSPRTLDIGAGVTLLVVAALLVWDIVQG
jgi:Ca2+/H+ antiporter, TMEM165/GDT1 family